jgi:hypothetical protein
MTIYKGRLKRKQKYIYIENTTKGKNIGQYALSYKQYLKWWIHTIKVSFDSVRDLTLASTLNSITAKSETYFVYFVLCLMIEWKVKAKSNICIKHGG